MKPQSAKAKGRNLQKWTRERLIEELDIHPEDIKSTSMGAGGDDVIECKNQEKLNVWSAYDQAESNSGDYEPLVVIKRNRQKPLVVLDAEYFMKLHKN